MKKFCTKCGKPFDAVGREVICPSCKAAAAEETKRAAVERAKRASWTGESVPVRISGRASTVIREFGKSHTMTFAESLDTLLRTSEYFRGTGVKWEDVTPYKSHRRDKHATETVQDKQDVKQDAPQASKPQGKAQDAQDVPQAAHAQAAQTAQAAKATSKTSTAKASKAASKTTSKSAASKSSSKSSKASK